MLLGGPFGGCQCSARLRLSPDSAGEPLFFVSSFVELGDLRRRPETDVTSKNTLLTLFAVALLGTASMRVDRSMLER